MTDYVFNWEDGNIDGTNTVNGPDGAVTVSISTPANGDGDSWFESTHTNGDSDTEVGSRSVKNATELNTTFSAPVANVSFEIFDVDSMAGSWDDKVTIIALDADGNQVPVTFSDLGFHTVNGNTIEGNGNSNPGVEGSGATDTVTVTIPGPIVSLQIIHDNGDSADTSGVVGLGSLNFDVVDTGNPGSDGPVDGENFGETMVLDYDDSNAPTDQGGDKITTGDDLIYGNGGDDYIEGDDGDDVIYGDSGDQTGETTTERVALEWSKAPAFGDFTLASDFSQTVGGVTVDVDFETNGSPLSIEYTSDEFNVDGIIDDGNPVNDESSIKFGSSNSDAAGTVDLNFSDEVENVSFRIADLDFAASVSVFAYDADGNLVPVTFVNEGVNVELEDENGDGVIETVEDANPTTGNPDTSDLNSVGVEIAGPVSRIEIVYDAESDLGSSTHISDIYFDATTTTDFGVPGNDTILGGEGDDVIFGEEGNDTLDGGEGVDTISGGDDRDTILGGAGDTVDGGAGGDDFDTLDLTGKGPFFLDNVVTDSNGNGIDGTVVFVDGDGNPTGETITFTEIEDIIGDNIGDGPDANDDTATVDEDDSVTIPVLANDTDPDGDPLTVTEATSPDGDVTINPDGTITFTPDPDFNGPTTITYTVEDPDGNEDTATVDVTVNPVNDAPVANDDTAETPEDTPVTIPVLDNDTDVDGDPLTVTEATSPDGDVTINPDGTITFTPDPDFSGPTTITYTVEDPDGEEDEGTVTVNVTPDADDPIANDDTAETDEDTPVTIPVLANDTDPDGDPLTVTEATSPDGDVTINPDGTITFTPDPDFNGPTTITYTVEDPDGNEDTATVDVTVNPVNDAPVANDDDDTTEEDTPIVVDLLDNDFDVDGDDLTVISATVPADEGSLVDNGDGTVTFTPAPNFTGTATITYTIEDEDGLTDTAEHKIDVTPDADDPIANDDTAETDEDTPVTIPVLDNDTDPDGDPLTVTEATSPDGDVTINPDGTITFTPDPDFNGPTTITYTVEDPDGNEDTATVDVTVNPVNDAPVANDDTATTPEDTPVTIPVLANDEDVDGDPLTVTEATSPDGDVDINPDGTITFTPDPGFTGPATITYTIEDPDGEDDTAEVIVNVTNDPDAPVAVDDDGGETLTGTPVTIDALANDFDPDGDDLTIIAASVPADEGTVQIVDNKIVFTPAPGFEGPVTIDYTIEDEENLTDDAIITVNVRNGIVNGTDGNDVIDEDYLGDPGGDEVDNGDAVLPGEGPDDDIIDAGDGDDIIDAGAGDDDVDGGAGDDIIDTGEGSDTVDGGDGDDIIDTGANDPMLIDKSYPGVFVGEEGTPAIFDDRDTVFGGDGNDTISTGDDEDMIDGGDGDDIIDGGIDDDTILGGAGDDRIVGGEGEDVIDGGDGDDLIYAGNDPDLVPDVVNIEDDGSNPFGPDLRPDNGRDTVFGGEGNDTIFGADDADELFGEEGDDFIDGEIDDDFIDGGEGDDTLLGGQGDDKILGGDGNDAIDGGIGDDDLEGGADRDTFTNVNAGDTVDGGGAGDDFDVLDLRGSAPEDGSLEVTFTNPDGNGNGFDGFVTYFDEDGNETGTLTFTEIEDVIPCFTPGTLIATPRGEIAVEELQVGDRVITRDNGIQEIRWVGQRGMTASELERSPHLKPIMIRKGALGHGLPERDMLVSPNHRVLVSNDKTALYFEEREVLVAAKHLTGLDGVEIADVQWTTYIHVMFDQHEVILSDGAWTESFQPGDMTLGSMGNAQRNEIFELFPELKTREGVDNYTAARRSLKKHEAQLLMQ